MRRIMRSNALIWNTFERLSVIFLTETIGWTKQYSGRKVTVTYKVEADPPITLSQEQADELINKHFLKPNRTLN